MPRSLPGASIRASPRRSSSQRNPVAALPEPSRRRSPRSRGSCPGRPPIAARSPSHDPSEHHEVGVTGPHGKAPEVLVGAVQAAPGDDVGVSGADDDAVSRSGVVTQVGSHLGVGGDRDGRRGLVDPHHCRHQQGVRQAAGDRRAVPAGRWNQADEKGDPRRQPGQVVQPVAAAPGDPEQLPTDHGQRGTHERAVRGLWRLPAASPETPEDGCCGGRQHESGTARHEREQQAAEPVGQSGEGVRVEHGGGL